jgi:hypothetical protein
LEWKLWLNSVKYTLNVKFHFWKCNVYTTKGEFHHLRWFQFHFWLQIRFLHVKSPYRTVNKTSKRIIFHETQCMQYSTKCEIYWRGLKKAWMNEWKPAWASISFRCIESKIDKQVMAKGGVYPPLLWLVQYLRVWWLPPPVLPEAVDCLYHLSFFFRRGTIRITLLLPTKRKIWNK